MYVIAHFIERKGMTDELLRDALYQRFTGNVGIVLGKTTGFACMPFSGTSDDARAILDNDDAIPGSGKLMWFEPYMLADIQAGWTRTMTNPAAADTRPSSTPSLSGR